MVILKANKSNFFDSCSLVPSLKDSYNIWKNREHNPSYFALQRYVVPPAGSLFKIRVFYNTQKSVMLFRTIRRKDLTPAPSPEPKKGWTRLKNSNRVSGVDLKDNFFVRNGEENAVYDSELKNSAIQEQVKSIKKVIETVGCSDGSFLLLELYIDFIQDFSGTWHFLNVVNYKLEFIVNKKPSTDLPKMKRRVASTSALKSNKTKNSESLSGFQTLQDSLINEVIQDFHSKKPRNLNSTHNLYCKAFHLKLINL